MKRNRLTILTSTAVLIVGALLETSSRLTVVRVSAQKQGSARVLAHPEVKILPSKEKRWALIIGVDNFGLKGAVNDAKAMKNVLVRYAGFPERQIKILTTDDLDNLPNRSNILSELDELSRTVPADGLFLFSFSGHGKTVDNSAYLIPSDGRMTTVNKLLRDFSIDVTRIREAIEEMKVRQVVMFIDACRDHIEGRGSKAEPLTSTMNRSFSFDETNRDIQAFVTLYATSLGESAYEYLDDETKQWRGYFNRAIEEALSGRAGNDKGEVTLANLVKYLNEAVPTRSYRIKGVRQTPWQNSNGYKESELVLAMAPKTGTGQSSSSNPLVVSSTETSDPQQYFARSLASFNKGDFDRALVDINKAIEISPAFAQAYAVRAGIYHVKNQHDNAIADSTKAIELKLNNEAPYLVRGASNNMKGNFDQALVDFNKALQINPQSGPAYSGRGVSYKGKGEYDKAIVDYTRGIALVPNEMQTYYNRGDAYFQKKDYDRALADFNKTIELNPNLAVAYQYRALVYDKKGDGARAETDRRKYRDLYGIK